MISVLFLLFSPVFIFFNGNVYVDIMTGIPKVVSSLKWYGLCDLAKVLLIHRELNFWRG